jgi:hypothetical protein
LKEARVDLRRIVAVALLVPALAGCSILDNRWWR